MKLEQLIEVIDVLTWVEITKTGDRTIFQGRLKDLKDVDLDLHVYNVLPNSSRRETYLEILVY